MQKKRPDNQAIKSALEQVLFAPAFLRSARQAKFLRYIIEQNLNNPNKTLTGFDIASDCFSRPVSNDPNDAFIRNIASRTRRSLKSHYDALAQLPAVVIQIAAKGYSPIYSCSDEVGFQSTTSISHGAPETPNNTINGPPPTIAVLPFQCLAGDKLQGVMGELISDSLITSLAKSKDLRVISRRTSSQFGRSNHTTNELGETLGLNYVVEGKFFVHGDAIRLQVELCCCRSDEIVWAEALYSTVEAVLSETDSIVEQTLLGVTQHLLDHELQRVASAPLKSLQCHSLMKSSTQVMHRGDPIDFHRAKGMLDLVARRNPHHAMPFAYLALLSALKIAHDSDYRDADMDEEFMHRHIEYALERNPQDPVALTTKGVFKSHFENDIKGACDLYEQAIRHSPNEVAALGRLSAAQLYTESTTRARESSSHAIEISPFDPELYFFHSVAAAAAFGEKKYEVAVENAEISKKLFPNHIFNLRTLIGSYSALGDKKNTERHKKKLLQLDPTFTLEKYHRAPTYSDNEILKRLAHFLGESGIPVGTY